VRKRELIKRLRAISSEAGTEAVFLREGANHELWKIAGERIVIPRHREINERTARSIIEQARRAAAHGETTD
jgi:mRNA interferase HicA